MLQKLSEIITLFDSEKRRYFSILDQIKVSCNQPLSWLYGGSLKKRLQSLLFPLSEVAIVHGVHFIIIGLHFFLVEQNNINEKEKCICYVIYYKIVFIM